MFAPYCSTCQRLVLLGARRVVALARHDDGALRVVLRCFCGSLVDDEARSPREGGGDVVISVRPAAGDAA